MVRWEPGIPALFASEVLTALTNKCPDAGSVCRTAAFIHAHSGRTAREAALASTRMRANNSHRERILSLKEAVR